MTATRIRQSMGRPGSALDNAVIESWHSTVKFELRRMEHFHNKATPGPPWRPKSMTTTPTGATPRSMQPGQVRTP
jgi:transposase InsO family protein